MVLVLLIIFMLTAPILQSGIEVDVPKTQNGERDHRRAHWSSPSTTDQRVFLGNDPVNINEIGERLQQKIRDPRDNRFCPLRRECSLWSLRDRDGCGKAGRHYQRQGIVTPPHGPAWQPTLIFSERDNWTKPLAASVALHGLLFGSILLHGAILGYGRGESWGGTGGGGGAMSATLVSSIPLPANPEGRNVLATDSKGLTQSLPKEEEQAPEAIAIPEPNAKVRPPRVARSTTQQKPQPAETATNMIPFGQGGPLSGPYSVTAGGAKGGFGFSGGGGDFRAAARLVHRTCPQKSFRELAEIRNRSANF